MMSYIIGGMILLAIITGTAGGNMSAVSTAAMNGCGQAVQLVISLTGTICLWSGVMGIADRIIVMCDGRITGELMAEDATQEKILSLATQFEKKIAI